MNQLWRNIKKAAKAGVVVIQRGSVDDLPEFHRLYVETAERDHFRPRPLSYFHTMFDALLAEDPDRSGFTWPTTKATWSLRPPGYAWASTPGSYGASSTAKRDVRGSNAVQWKMITDALEAARRSTTCAVSPRALRRMIHIWASFSSRRHRRRGGGIPVNGTFR